jgi:hypothetical protein
MKLITLNTWGGRVAKPLTAFLEAQKDRIDFFCFQEIFSSASDSAGDVFINTDKMNKNLFGEMSRSLVSHKGIFCPVDGETYGIASFISSDTEILDFGGVIVYENKCFLADPNPDADHTRKAQWMLIKSQGKELALINLHGHWTHTKIDDQDRISQSQKLLELIGRFSCPIILCGDFNLRPDTESIAMLEKSGMQNLIKEYGVTSTRTAIYTKSEKYADYIFVSKDIKVNDFKVMPDEVSDHAPLFLDFEVM